MDSSVEPPEEHLPQAAIPAGRERFPAVIEADVNPAAHVRRAGCRRALQIQLEELLDRADKALYHAKKTGRNRTALYSEDLEEED